MHLLKQESLLICTCNRYASLKTVSEHLSACTAIPSSIYLIDASDERQTLRLLNWFSWYCGDLKLVESEAHLTKQRNRGISLAKENNSILHFIDDDFYPEPDYFKHISAFLKQSTESLGVGGQTLPVQNKPSTWIERFFLLNADTPGKVLKSGRTTEPQAIEYADSVYETQFLSGCSMSFKSSVFQQFCFDEELKAYGQDEDILFCLQLPASSLFVEPKAKGFHKKEPSNRLNRTEFKKMAVLHRFYVMRKQTQVSFSTIAFMWSCLGQIISLLTHPFKNRFELKGFLSACFQLLK